MKFSAEAIYEVYAEIRRSNRLPKVCPRCGNETLWPNKTKRVGQNYYSPVDGERICRLCHWDEAMQVKYDLKPRKDVKE